MQIKVYINNQLYKTIPTTESQYDPKPIWIQLQTDKSSGLLSAYNVDKEFNIRIEKVN
jgi:hypothetical protein